jgi:hypothetical protein
MDDKEASYKAGREAGIREALEAVKRKRLSGHDEFLRKESPRVPSRRVHSRAIQGAEEAISELLRRSDGKRPS